MNKKNLELALVIFGAAFFIYLLYPQKTEPVATPVQIEKVVYKEDPLIEEVNVLFLKSRQLQEQGDYDGAIKIYDLILSDKKYDVEFAEHNGHYLAQIGRDQALCSKEFEMDTSARSAHETLMELVSQAHRDHFSCSVVADNLLPNGVGRFVDHEQALDLFRRKIRPNAKTFFKDTDFGENNYYRITNETEDKSDDIIVALSPNPFRAQRFRVTYIFVD